MLKEMAIADAYGAGFEFSSPEKIILVILVVVVVTVYLTLT